MASIYYEQYQLDIHAQKEARIKQNMTVKRVLFREIVFIEFFQLF